MTEKGDILQNRLLAAAALVLGLFFCANCGVAQADYTVGTRVYLAEAGDTFAILERRLGFEGELLAAMNNLSPGYCCRGGEKILLPVEPPSGLTTLASRGSYAEALRASGSGSKIWQEPLQGVLTSAFASSRGDSNHHGLDIAADTSSPIKAAHNGTVLEAGWKNSVYGYAVVIDHGNGWQTLYGHCSKVLVNPGDTVKQGQKIALVGSTGNSTGPHLHLELKKDGVYLNPNAYFSDLAV